MIQSIKISGFKNFRGKSIELTSLKRINVLVGINGSGKSSILELLMGVSKLSQLNADGLQDIIVKGQSSRLHSLFEPETRVSFSYDTSPESYHLRIVTQIGDRWQVEKNGRPHGGTEVVAIMRPGTAPFNNVQDSTNRQEQPFGGITVFDRDKHIVPPDLDEANSILAKVNPSQRSLRKMNLSGGQFTFETDNEIRTEFLAGGSRYIAGLIAAIRAMRNKKPLLIVDDLGDELFPAVRKQLIPEINTLLERLPEKQFAQMFATTHNIEIVKSALEHPEYCSVYMFDYDGALIRFQDSKQYKTISSDGVQTADAIPAIAKMLGMDDLDLGYPEIIILSEEESKKSFIEGLASNPNLRDKLRKVEVHVPFQVGDGNTSKAIQNMLDLSKYLFFSEVWSNRYVVFVDYNSTDYEEDGTAKSNSTRQKALLIAQQKLGHDQRFILTKKGNSFVDSLEETYPKRLWEQYKVNHNVNYTSPKLAIEAKNTPQEKGKFKNDLATYISSKITEAEFINAYPSISRLLLKTENLPNTTTPTITAADEPPQEEDIDDIDDMYAKAVSLVIELRKASTSLLQRRLRVGYARAARLIEEMETNRVIGPADGSRPRKVLIEDSDA
jgi:hypothetical protein